jgi:hypothetical protein
MRLVITLETAGGDITGCIVQWRHAMTAGTAHYRRSLHCVSLNEYRH